MGIRWQQRVSNEELRQRTKQPPVTSLLKKRRLKPEVAGTCNVDGGKQNSTAGNDLGGRWEGVGRKPGRPKTTWLQTINRDLADMQISMEDVKELAQNRAEWRNLVSASCDEWRKKK